jgi:hypothetical protein
MYEHNIYIGTTTVLRLVCIHIFAQTIHIEKSMVPINIGTQKNAEYKLKVGRVQTVNNSPAHKHKK